MAGLDPAIQGSTRERSNKLHLDGRLKGDHGVWSVRAECYFSSGFSRAWRWSRPTCEMAKIIVIGMMPKTLNVTH